MSSSMRRRTPFSSKGPHLLVPVCEDDKTQKDRGKDRPNLIWVASSLVLLFVVLILLGPASASREPQPIISHVFTPESREQSDLELPTQLLPGQIAPLIWKSDQTLANPNGGLIGLPPELTESIYQFCQETGLLGQFERLLYETEMEFDQVRLLDVGPGRTWSSMTPSAEANWEDSNIHWVDAADEKSYEETLRVLERGNFDVVLDAIGRHYDREGLMVAGMGFILSSYNYVGDVHRDLKEAEGFWWDLLFPLILPEPASKASRPSSQQEKEDSSDRDDVEKHTFHLMVADDDLDENDEDRVTAFPFTPNVGLAIGGDTRHATGRHDFRGTREFRVSVSIYIADVNAENAGIVSSDGTAIFPVPGRTDWLVAQEGRLWSKNDPSKSLRNDVGRRPLAAPVEDDNELCPTWAQQGLCETELWDKRLQCLKSCKVYLEDTKYHSELMNARTS